MPFNFVYLKPVSRSIHQNSKQLLCLFSSRKILTEATARYRISQFTKKRVSHSPVLAVRKGIEIYLIRLWLKAREVTSQTLEI